MKQSKAKEFFEAWWSLQDQSKDKNIAWEAYKKGIKIAEAYKG
jgi:hypothetical protein